MGPTSSEIRVIQIHPTLTCNLKCLHCYSSSGPAAHDSLSLEALEQILLVARQERYNAIGVSGGEPLVYPELPQLLAFAKSLGFITTVTTNGLLLDSRRIEQLQPILDIIAISLDGIPESHDKMRNMRHAFEKMTKRLSGLRDANISFGFIFTLTQNNLDELDWVAHFAVEQGSTLLQVHPLEEVGRAQSSLSQFAPDNFELMYAFLEAARLQKLFAGRLKIQLDIADIQLIREEPERGFASAKSPFASPQSEPLSNLVSPIILETNGTIIPIQYGFSHSYAIADVNQGDVHQQISQWKSERYQPFREMCRQVYEDLMLDGSLEFVNWYSAITQASMLSNPIKDRTTQAVSS